MQGAPAIRSLAWRAFQSLNIQNLRQSSHPLALPQSPGWDHVRYPTFRISHPYSHFALSGCLGREDIFENRQEVEEAKLIK